MSAVFTVGSIDLFQRVKPLWTRLRDHHAKASLYFSKELSDITCERRQSELSRKENTGSLFVCVASFGEQDVGYVVASTENSKAEIDSLFVLDSNQGTGIGTELVTRALDWIKDRQATSIYVNVAFGNTRALEFYRKFDIFPRSINLERKTA